MALGGGGGIGACRAGARPRPSRSTCSSCGGLRGIFDTGAGAIPCPGDDMDMIVPDDRGVRNVHRDGGVRTMGCGDVFVVDQFR